MSEHVMSETSPEQVHEQIRESLDSLYRVDSGRILAGLEARDWGSGAAGSPVMSAPY